MRYVQINGKGPVHYSMYAIDQQSNAEESVVCGKVGVLVPLAEGPEKDNKMCAECRKHVEGENPGVA